MEEWQPGRGTWNRTAMVRRVESRGEVRCRIGSCRSEQCWATSFISAGSRTRVKYAHQGKGSPSPRTLCHSFKTAKRNAEMPDYLLGIAVSIIQFFIGYRQTTGQ